MPLSGKLFPQISAKIFGAPAISTAAATIITAYFFIAVALS